MEAELPEVLPVEPDEYPGPPVWYFPAAIPVPDDFPDGLLVEFPVGFEEGEVAVVPAFPPGADPACVPVVIPFWLFPVAGVPV